MAQDITEEDTEESRHFLPTNDYKLHPIPSILPNNKLIEAIPINKNESELTNKAIFVQVSMCFLINLSSISIGMGYGFPTITFDSLTNQTDPMAMSYEQASWIASVTAINIPVGCLVCSYILDLIGRRKTFFVINIISIISWTIMATASTTDKELMFAEMLVARIILGISTGCISSPACVYCSEIAHKSIRGRLVIFPAFCISVGTVLTYLLGYFLPNDWRIISWIACSITILSTIILLFVPETPRWLASKGRIDEAEYAIKILRGLPKKGSIKNSEIRQEFIALQEQSATATTIQSKSTTICEIFRRPEVYKPFILMCSMFAFQQLTGIFVVIVYAVQFCKASGVPIDPFLCAVAIGSSRAVATILIGFCMDKYDRRKPAIFSSCSMTICMFGIAAYVYNGNDVSLNWLPVVLVIGFLFTSTFGLLTMSFTMVAEVFPQDCRGLASGFTTSFGFVICFLVLKLYPTMVIAVGDVVVFIYFGIVSLISVAFLYFYLPETKGKSLEEIEQMFKGEMKTVEGLDEQRKSLA